MASASSATASRRCCVRRLAVNPRSANGAAAGAARVAGGIELGDVRCDVENSGVSTADAALHRDDVGREIGAG